MICNQKLVIIAVTGYYYFLFLKLCEQGFSERRPELVTLEYEAPHETTTLTMDIPPYSCANIAYFYFRNPFHFP